MRYESYPTPDAHSSFSCVGLSCDHVCDLLGLYTHFCWANDLVVDVATPSINTHNSDRGS
jgi:hypothetical protein